MAAMKPRGKTVEVEIWTDKYRIKGQVFIPLADLGAYKGRLSDYLNDHERTFIPVTHVTLGLLNGNEVIWDGRFLAVNKSSIALVRALRE